jgi:hydroxymethylpyrimidine pyrophosphatase-like HAD family hydrolase
MAHAGSPATRGATVARAVRCLYVDLDGTLLGPGASLLRGAGGSFSLDGVRALQACDRAGVEVVLFSGRKQASVYEGARLIGQSSYIFELGCGLVLDGELEWLTGGVEPTPERGSIFEQITASGAPQRLLEHFAGRLEYHTPWADGREVSHLFRGSVDLNEAHVLLAEMGCDWLRMVDNGVVTEHASEMPQLSIVHVYHVIPAAASKAAAVARHMQTRGYRPEDCIAVGDSREDLDAARAVGRFWLVGNALTFDPTLAAAVNGHANVRIAEGEHGAGVYEAVVTTLAAGLSAT